MVVAQHQIRGVADAQQVRARLKVEVSEVTAIFQDVEQGAQGVGDITEREGRKCNHVRLGSEGQALPTEPRTLASQV